MFKGRKRLGNLLIEAGIITKEQLDKALSVQQKTNERLGRVLLNLGYVSEDSMIEVLEFQLGVPHVDLANLPITKEVAAAIPVSLAERYQIIPIKREGKKLTLAMVDPTNFYAIDDVRMVTNCEIDTVIAAEREIMRAISQAYGVQDLVDKAVNKLKPEDYQTMTEFQTADDAPIISLVNSLFSQAVRERASDIHIEPQDKTLRVRFRIDGILREISSFTKDIYAAIVSRIKIMAEMDIAEKRLPQDGRIKIRDAGRDIDIRVSTLPTILGEKVVMRILDKKAVILDISKLGFSSDNLYRYRRLFSQSYGMILVTGPTGSGKTTTLYSTLSEISSPEKNVITVEDPVEYRVDGINQVQVNPKAGLTFASGLRSILRQDPNIVMVGEIRDGETADIAVRAALTGHLVLSTLHTNDAPGAITRLTDMGVEPFLVASSVLGVIAQRLVRLICPECRKSYTLEPDSVERLFLGLAPDQPITLYHGSGCASCGYTGYHGRIAIHEVMPVSTQIRELINKGASSDKFATIAKQEGMLSMREDGINKAIQGLTTVAEVMRVAYAGV
ncbi:MAG: type II secretion system ATPase GspE [Veillonellaceae bacterium]|jgi:type IV pilus assembly protein PilB|nr:type II secretion system ATPase GspE [Veillonellaceae bacterium]